MRGDLDSRPIGDVLAEAKRLVEAGVKELLVISQDTSGPVPAPGSGTGCAEVLARSDERAAEPAHSCAGR